MDLAQGSPVHKLFSYYIFLNELSKYPNGISGYRIRKAINEIMLANFNKNGNTPLREISQSLVYRVFRDLKEEGLIEGKEHASEGRRKILYSLNDRGTRRLAFLKRAIQNMAPTEADPSKYTEDFFAGKISPLEFLPKNLPPEELLKMVRNIRNRIERILGHVNKKIEELEKELA